MSVTAIVGAQWGDEGKGKITDLLAQDADLVMRYGGGGNAGHTVVNKYGEFKLHLCPSGIFNSKAISLVGTGTVVDFDFLTEELEQLQAAKISTDGLRISTRAHVVMPYHILLDRLGDEARGKAAIGTTGRGVGPAYVDKADRIGIQVSDLLDPAVLRRKLEFVLPQKNRILTEIYRQNPLSFDDVVNRASCWRQRYKGIIVDQMPLVLDALETHQAVLLEGQLGALRDLDWGTYPFVTSSTTIAGGGGVGGGIPPTCIDRVVGVVKAYTSAVGAGPVPTELDDEIGGKLREQGGEYGATTGRARRVGWFDAVATRYACTLNRFNGIAVTKLDVLDGMDPLKICTSYLVDGREYETIPPTDLLERAVPQYEELPGWSEATSGAKEWDDLPRNARNYLERIEELVRAPVTIVSVGRDRAETIILSGPS
jgi:adenylosuccinate synthase